MKWTAFSGAVAACPARCLLTPFETAARGLRLLVKDESDGGH